MTEVYFISEHVTYYDQNKSDDNTNNQPSIPTPEPTKQTQNQPVVTSENTINNFSASKKSKNKLITLLTKDLIQRVGRLEKIIFTRHLVSLQRAGIPILESIVIAKEETNDKTLKIALQEVFLDMENGKPFSESLSKHPKIFNPLFVAMVKVAEQNGRLPEVFAYLLKQQEDEYQLITKVKGAMIYPVIIMIVIVVMVTGMLTFVIPQIALTYTEAGISLPLFTRILINLSKFITTYGIFIASGGVALFLAIKYITKQGKGKKIKDQIILRIPIYGKITKELQLTRLTHALSDLIKSGISTDIALKTVSNVTHNSLYKNSLLLSSDFVHQGQSLTDTLKNNRKLYPHMLIQMGRVGEKTGKVDEMLGHISKHYEENVLNKTNNLSTVLEPILLITAGVLIGSIALAILMPIWNFVQII